MKRTVAGVLTVLALACACPAQAPANDLKDRPDKPAARPATYKGPKVALKVTFTPGAYVLTETMTMPMTMTMTVSGRDRTMKTDITMAVGGGIEISKPNESGEQDVRFSCRAVKTTISMLGQTMQYDSAGPADKQTPQLARALKPLVGVEVTLTGKEGKWKNVSEALTTVLAKIGDRQMRQQMRGMWEPFLQEMLTKHWARMIPTKPVGPGDEWASSIKVASMPMLGDMAFDANCRLRDVVKTPAGQVAVIDFVVKAKVADKTIPPAEGGPPVKMVIDTLQTYMTGTVRFNMDIGLGTNLVLNQDLAAVMSANQGALNMTVALDGTVKYVNTLTKAKPAKDAE